MKKRFRKVFNFLKYYFWYSANERKFINIKNEDEGDIFLYNQSFYYHHGLAFYNTYREIFQEEIYKFVSQNPSPLIIDCGANMGLSVLYFSKEFPNAQIIAFEPDEKTLPFLRKNISIQGLKNVKLIEKAVWINNDLLNFYTDNGMGGRIGATYENQYPKQINSVRLRDYLMKPVEMLKIDIEGAEYVVLKDCADRLKNVNHIFVEYHSFFDEEQHLEDILILLKQNGFRYHLKESFSRNSPFIDKRIICQKYDMAINIFAYRT